MARIESYYDDVPRASAAAEAIGPFTLFVRRGDGWPFYARPTLGAAEFHPSDVRRVRERQRELGIPEAFEWVHEVTPALADVAVEAGLAVARHPLMVLPDGADTLPRPSQVRLLRADDRAVAEVQAAVGAAFAETDQVDVSESAATQALRRGLVAGTMRLVGAFDDEGHSVGGGTHSPRGSVSELTGIAVLPRARNRGIGAAITAALVQDARELGVDTVFLSAGSARVAAVYGRVGFESIGTACIAEPP